MGCYPLEDSVMQGPRQGFSGEQHAPACRVPLS